MSSATPRVWLSRLLTSLSALGSAALVLWLRDLWEGEAGGSRDLGWFAVGGLAGFAAAEGAAAWRASRLPKEIKALVRSGELLAEARFGPAEHKAYVDNLLCPSCRSEVHSTYSVHGGVGSHHWVCAGGCGFKTKSIRGKAELHDEIRAKIRIRLEGHMRSGQKPWKRKWKPPEEPAD